MGDIRIDEPGAGAWIMERAHGYFRDGWDHSFSSHRDGRILGGFALVGYFGASMTMHMAAEDPRWFSRDLAWLAFHYPFRQLKCRKLLAPVKSTDYTTIAMNLRAGWTIEAVLKDTLPDGHMLILGMTEDACHWLDHQPVTWREAA
jgi:hypothetical protein